MLTIEAIATPTPVEVNIVAASMDSEEFGAVQPPCSAVHAAVSMGCLQRWRDEKPELVEQLKPEHAHLLGLQVTDSISLLGVRPLSFFRAGTRLVKAQPAVSTQCKESYSTTLNRCRNGLTGSAFGHAGTALIC